MNDIDNIIKEKVAQAYQQQDQRYPTPSFDNMIDAAQSKNRQTPNPLSFLPQPLLASALIVAVVGITYWYLQPSINPTESQLVSSTQLILPTDFLADINLNTVNRHYIEQSFNTSNLFTPSTPP